ncbi:MAG: hypothetical protein ACLU1S_00760, partial [Eubacterium sp.]
MFFSIIHALIPNFYVLFSIVYSLFFVLGELSGFYTPFDVFYNKGVGLPVFSFLTSSQLAEFYTPFDVFYNKGVGLPAFSFLVSSQPAGFYTPFDVFYNKG